MYTNVPNPAVAGGVQRNDRLDMWMMQNQKFFPSERVLYLRERLSHLPEEHFNNLYALQFKDPTIALILSIFTGALGIDRFWLGDVGLGIGKLAVWLLSWIFIWLLVGFLFYAWWIVDIFFVQNRAKEMNFQTIIRFLAYYGL